MLEATLLGPVGRAQGWVRPARLYALAQPLRHRTLLEPQLGANSPTTRHLVISSAPDHTMAFAASERGYTPFGHMLALARAQGPGQFDQVLAQLGYVENPFKPFLVTLASKDPASGGWAPAYRKLPVLARSAGAEVDILLEQSFGAGRVKVIDVEACSAEDHEAVFRQIHQQECQASGINEPFDPARHQPLKAC